MALPTISSFFTVVADPDIKSTASGNIVANIRLVANDSKRLQDGSYEQTGTVWLRGTAWNEVANSLQHAVKGDSVQVTGKLRTNEWEDKNSGDKRQSTEIDIQMARVYPKGQKQQGGFQANGGGIQQHAAAQQQNVNQAAQQFGQQGMAQQQADPWGTAPGQQQFGQGYDPSNPPF